MTKQACTSVAGIVCRTLWALRARRARGRAHSMHYARIGRAVTQIRPRRKMHDFGDLGRALEMVALLPGVALGG